MKNNNKKLKLDRETVRVLNPSDLATVNGGFWRTWLGGTLGCASTAASCHQN